MQPIAHYNILERLGVGALGDVYRARDLKYGRTVALMTPASELIADPAVRERFLADARGAAALNHPNIAQLFDVLEQDGRCYLAYEFAAGPSLRDEMGGRAVNLRRSLEIVAQITDALAEGHSRGVIHGDLRPENVVVTPKGSVKILNFGLARWTTGGRARLAAPAPEGLGSDPQGVAAYLSPEQALGTGTDGRSDLFSVGVVLHEMLSGRNPFAALTPSATIINVIRAPAPGLGLGPSAPPQLAALVARLLAKPVDARPQNAASISSELRQIVGALDAREGNAPPTELIPPQAKQGSGLWIALGAIAVLAVVVWWML
jgi:serine/threonine protein kinase